MTFPTAEHIKAAQAAEDYWLEKTGHRVWASVTLAQAFIESAGWTRLAGANNGFGLKASKAQIDAGKASLVWTREESGGVMRSVQQWFANYGSLEEAYIEHGRVLATVGYYKDAWKAKNALEFLDGIRRYATATNYRASLKAVMDRMNLYQYDRDLSAPAKPEPKATNPGVVIGGAAGAGVVISKASDHLAGLNVGAIAAFVLVAAIVAAVVLITRHRQAATNLAAATAKPDPHVVKLLDQHAPLPEASPAPAPSA